MRTVRFLCVFVACLAMAVPVTSAHGAEPESHSRFLTGQFLVAARKMPDPRFGKTVVLITEHDTTGAMGFVINKIFGEGPLSTFLNGFGIKGGSSEETIGLHYGGPVEIGLAAVLHGTDYSDSSTKRISKNLAWSSHRDVFEAIAAGKGPKKRVFILGYSGWAAGQLESELAREDWLTAPADAELIFDKDFDTLWGRILAKAGIKL
ncbi:MAG: YqgE/AlgH family protein [Rhodospirillales bacterium]